MRRRGCAVLAGFFAAASLGVAHAGESADGLLSRAEQALASGRYGDALDLARRASATAPGAARVLLAHASIADAMGEFDEAAAAYRRARELAPSDPAVQYSEALHAVRVGDYDAALRNLDAIFTGALLPIRLLFQYAPTSVQTVLRRHSAVIEHLVQLRIDILMDKGDLAGARRYARDYGVIGGGHDYCAEAMEMHQRQVAPEQWSQAFRLAVLAQPQSGGCLWRYGQALTDEGYMRLGRLMVSEALKHGPSEAAKMPGVRFYRSRLANGRDVPKRAESLFLIARQRYLRDRDVEGAIRLLEQAVRVAPDFARPHTLRARIAREADDIDTALVWLQRGINADKASWRTHHNLGMLLTQLEYWDDAEVPLRRAIDLFPEDVGARLALGRVLYVRRNYDEYVAETRRALDVVRTYGNDLTGMAEVAT